MAKCPLCSHQASTLRGLRKHLSGTPGYGGHNCTEDEIDALLGSASPPARVPASIPPEFEGTYLGAVWGNLAGWKAAPKYQFERRVDVFLSVFLPEILADHLGGRFELVAPEFPLKDPLDRRSRNADYLFFWRPAEGPARWVLFELKTDPRSVGREQVMNYISARDKGMPALVADLVEIRGGSDLGWKYDALAARLAPFPAERGVDVIFLAPTRLDIAHRERGVISITFADLQDFEPSRFQAEWRFFKALLLPLLLR